MHAYAKACTRWQGLLGALSERMTSLEPSGDCRPDEKQTNPVRGWLGWGSGGGGGDKMSHEREFV